MSEAFKCDELIVTVKDIDISSMVVDCSIYHDIQGVFTTANITIADISNFIMENSVRQYDDVTVKVKDGIYEEEYIFILNAIEDTKYTNQEALSYVLKLVTPEFIKSQKEKVCLYTNTKLSETVEKICKRYLGVKIDADKSSNSVNVIIPQYDVAGAISFISKHCIDKTGADFFFFQRFNDEFCYYSLEEMIKKETGREYKVVYSQKNDDDSLYGRKADAFAITNYTVVDTQNSIANLLGGAIGSTYGTYDYITNEYKVNEFKLGDAFQKDLDNAFLVKNVVPSSTNSKYIETGFSSNLFKDGNSILDRRNETTQSRLQALLKLETGKVIIEVAGYAKCYEMLGKMIKLELPSQRDDKGDGLDKRMTGEYAVTAMKQYISRSDYTNVYECVKLRDSEQQD